VLSNEKSWLEDLSYPTGEILHFQGKSAETEKGKARIEYYRSRYHYFRKNRGSFQSSVLSSD